MKKLKIVGFILLITIVVLNICSVSAFAASNDPILNPDFWEPTVSGDESLNEKVGVILGVIQVLGVITSVIVLMVLGIKYMLGSAEEKAVNKKAMIPYLVGAVMVFSVTTIPNVIFKMSESFFKEKTQAEIAQDRWNNWDCAIDGHAYDLAGETGECDHCGEQCTHENEECTVNQFSTRNTYICRLSSYRATCIC